MPQIVFKNEQNRTFEVLPEGDYILEAVEVESALSKGQKTRGSEVLSIKFKSVEHGTDFWDDLIFHESCMWKIDTFCNCFGMASKEGETVELNEETILGRRGWVRVFVDTFTGSDGKEKKKNKVRVYYTDKEKIARATIPQAESAAAGSDDPDWN